MPAVVVFECRRIHAIEIAATGNGGCYCNRIAHLHAFRFRLRRHREISDRAREVRRRIWW